MKTLPTNPKPNFMKKPALSFRNGLYFKNDSVGVHAVVDEPGGGGGSETAQSREEG